MPDGSVIDVVLEGAQVDVVSSAAQPVDVTVAADVWVDVQQDPIDVVEIITPGPQGPPGPGADPAQVAAQVDALVAAYLITRPAQVFRFDDPVATWPMPHAFGRPPSVALYSTSGRQIRTDVDVDASHASARFPYPVPGFAVLT